MFFVDVLDITRVQSACEPSLGSAAIWHSEHSTRNTHGISTQECHTCIAQNFCWSSIYEFSTFIPENISVLLHSHTLFRKRGKGSGNFCYDPLAGQDFYLFTLLKC